MRQILFFCIILSVSNIASSVDTYKLANELGIRDSRDFSVVQQIVKSQQVTSLQGFLDLWHKQRPDYFSNYVLGYRSRSLQESSPVYPRAILFNTNADLIFSFNGHPSQRGYSNIEMVRFNHNQKSFEFYEMSFNEGQTFLSKPNPKKCLSCHQSSQRGNIDPRPNWEPYNTWPGFYGSIDDNTALFKDNYNTQKDFDKVRDKIILEEIQQESDWYNNFIEQIRPHHPRYVLLRSNLIDQYGSEGTLNGDLTNRLAVLNFQRVARLIRTQNPILYQSIKWTTWAHAKCGQEIHMPRDVFEWLYSQVNNLGYQRYLERREQDKRRASNSQMEMDVGLGGDKKVLLQRKSAQEEQSDRVRARTTDLINVLFEAFGESTDDWSMDFKTDGGRFAAFERFGLTNDPRPPWMRAIEREFSKDPDFEAVSCADVQKKSRTVFSSIKKAQALVEFFRKIRPKRVSKPLQAQCTSCHVAEASYLDIPYIPFDNNELLRSALKKTGYKRGTLLEEILFRIGSHATQKEQMPLNIIPTTKQKQELINNLTSL